MNTNAHMDRGRTKLPASWALGLVGIFGTMAIGTVAVTKLASALWDMASAGYDDAEPFTP